MIEVTAPPDPEPETYDLREEPAPVAAAVLPLEEPPPGKLSLDATGKEIPRATPAKVLNYRRVGSLESRQSTCDARSRRRDLWVPLAMIAFSAALILGLAIIMSKAYLFPIPAIAAHLGMRIIWDIAMMLIAGLVIQWFIDTGLGEFHIAVLKLVALAVFRFSISAIVQPDGNIGMAMLGFLITFPMLIYLFGYLFEFDFTESMFSTVLFTMMRLISYFGLWKIL